MIALTYVTVSKCQPTSHIPTSTCYSMSTNHSLNSNRVMEHVVPNDSNNDETTKKRLNEGTLDSEETRYREIKKGVYKFGL